MSSLRPIAAITLPPGSVRSTEFGDKPERIWVAPTELLVDDEYQRDLNRKSFQLIARMVAGFKWRKFKTPSCVRVGKKLHVIDGQHSAIAAATLLIPKIPVDVVDAQLALERADSFVSHNRDRLMMTPFDIFRALVGAGDPAAKAVDKVCRDSGVRIIRVLNKLIVPKVGDTAAVGLIGGLVRRRGLEGATRTMTALVRAGRAPISAAEIAAAEEVMFLGDSRLKLTASELTAAARQLGTDGVIKCSAKAKTDLTTTKVVLAAAYRRAAGANKKAA